jgi:hypothetical protein
MKYDFYRPLGGKGAVYAVWGAIVLVAVAVIWAILAALMRWMNHLVIVPRLKG